MSTTITFPPSLHLDATSGCTITTATFTAAPTVLYFYPKDNTPGCTQEGQDFANHYHEFQQLGIQIFGVSRDSLKKHDNFKAKYQFPFELISDPDEVLCQLFDVIKLKKLYGREYLGIERSTFLLNKAATIIESWRKVRVKGHVTDVLNACHNLLDNH